MPSPSTSLATLRPDLGGSLEEFDLMADMGGFIGMQVLPVIHSDVQSGPFGRIPIEQLLESPDTRRAPGSAYNRGGFTFTTDSFATEEHGHEEPVDDREARMYGNFFDAELLAAARARNIVMRSYEERVAAAVFNATTWTPTTITNEWDDYANATPIDDIEGGVQAAYAASGLWADTLIISRTVYRNLRQCVQIINRIASSGAGFPSRTADITTQQLAECFDLSKILVGGGTKNTANKGQAASLAGVWSNEYAMVCKTADTIDIREPCLGRTIVWEEDEDGVFESYRDETVRGDIVRHRHDADEKILYTECAALFDNVTT